MENYYLNYLNIKFRIIHKLSNFSHSFNVNRRVSFYVIVEGKVDEDLVNEQERTQKLEIEEDTSYDTMKEALDNIKRLHRKADLIQWEKKQSLSRDMSKMEATLSKLMIKHISLETTM